jgi:hypothetical protein
MKKQLCVTLAATAVLNGIVSRFFMGELTVNPSFYEKMPFDTEKDLVAITPFIPPFIRFAMLFVAYPLPRFIRF